MKILTKYIFVNLITYVSLVILFLFGLQIFIEFIHEFPSLGEGSYGLPQMLNYVILMLPYDIYQFFPTASLLGFIIALGLLASHSELIVMRTSGMSLLNISSAVIKVGMVLMVIMIILGEVLSPMAQRKAHKIKTAAITGGKVLLTQQGVWLYNSDRVINIHTVTNKGKLQDVTNYQLEDGNKLRLVSHAATGAHQEGRWVFYDVKQTEFKDTIITNSNIPQQESNLTFKPKLIGVKHLDTDQKNLFELYSYIKYLKQSGSDATRYLFIFWQRIFAPLAILIMILLAIPFVLGSLRNVTMGFRMLVGVIFGFIFYILHQIVGPMSIVYEVHPLLASVLPLMVFTIIGGLLLCRVR